MTATDFARQRFQHRTTALEFCTAPDTPLAPAGPVNNDNHRLVLSVTIEAYCEGCAVVIRRDDEQPWYIRTSNEKTAFESAVWVMQHIARNPSLAASEAEPQGA